MQPSLAEVFTLLAAAEKHNQLHVRGRALRALQDWDSYLEDWDGIIILYNEHSPRPIAPPIFTDASGGGKGGGGYVTFDPAYGYLRYSHWCHDSALRKRHINYLEGWAVLRALKRFGPSWAGHDVPLYLDNKVFMQCLLKKRSPSLALNPLLRAIMALCDQHNCRLVPFYISTEANILADALSRHRLDFFWESLDPFQALPWWGLGENEGESGWEE